MSGSFEILTDNTISIFKEGNRVATFKDIDEILQCKKDSKEWKIYMDCGMNYLFQIHERLKKWNHEIEVLLTIPEEKIGAVAHAATEDVHNKLQEILGDNK